MIGISTQVFDLDGSVIIEDSPGSNFGARVARISRTKTLDGGVYINHSGFAHGDRTFTVKADISQAQEKTILHIYENYKLVNVSTREGFFEAAIEECDTNNGELSMKILVNKKINEE